MTVFRVGRKLGTTLYRGDEPQPFAWCPDAEMAARIVRLLNRDEAEIAYARIKEYEEAGEPG